MGRISHEYYVLFIVRPRSQWSGQKQRPTGHWSLDLFHDPSNAGVKVFVLVAYLLYADLFHSVDWRLAEMTEN